MQNRKGISNILVVLIIVVALAVALVFAFRMAGGKPALPLKDTGQTTDAGSELSSGDEVVDIEGDLDSTSLDDVDRDLNEALENIDRQ